MAMFEEVNDQFLVNSKSSLTPHQIALNLNFLTVKNYGPKNPLPGGIRVPSIRPKFDDSNLALVLRVRSI